MSYADRSMRLVLLTLVLAACAEELPGADLPELHDLEQASVVMREAAMAVVRIEHPAGSAGTGSFISPDGLLLTNNHVLGGEACAREGCLVRLSFQHQRGTLSLPPRDVFAVPQHVDVGLDMAAVQIFLDEAKTQRLVSPHFLALEPRSADELVGEHVTAIGHPLGRLKKWSSGSVIHADGEWFDTSIFSLPGGSGSPILNDAGQLVGLLHRGAEGFDLFTETSTQVTAIASASLDLQRALAAPLPPSVISLADALSADDARSHSAAFLAASTWKANVEGDRVALVSLLATACDEGLAREDYTAFEELQGALSPCFTALDFIECRSDAASSTELVPKLCPTAELPAWHIRLHSASLKQHMFNGALDLSAVSFSTEVLAASRDAAEQTARTNLLATLDEVRPRLDFTVGSYLAAYGVDSYNGQSTRELFVHYADVPFYERYAWQIAVSALWLQAADQLTREQAIAVARALYRDPEVSLGAKLRIEELLYNADEL
jgi:hypothetical protein